MSNNYVRPTLIALAVSSLFSSAMAQTAAEATMPAVVVTDKYEKSLPEGATLPVSALRFGRVSSSDTASLLSNTPGVHVYGAGGVSSLPVIHGLADDRLRNKVDGMDLVASCPNHMNPALSYLDPSQVDYAKVYAGITPVSIGGDSIGGSIVVGSKAPSLPGPVKAI